MNNLIRALSIGALLGTAAHADNLTIGISNIEEPGGTINWQLFDSEEAYASRSNPVMAASSRVSGSSLCFTLHDLPPGDYALRLYHDANGNGTLDSNALGLPLEGYGFSNNAGRFGPASFKSAAFTVEGDTAIDVRVR